MSIIAMALLLQSADLPPVEPGLCWLTGFMENRLLNAVRSDLLADWKAAKDGKPHKHSETELGLMLGVVEQQATEAKAVMGRYAAPTFNDDLFKREDALKADDRQAYVHACAA